MYLDPLDFGEPVLLNALGKPRTHTHTHRTHTHTADLKIQFLM